MGRIVIAILDLVADRSRTGAVLGGETEMKNTAGERCRQCEDNQDYDYAPTA